MIDPYGSFGTVPWWALLRRGSVLGALGSLAALVFVGLVAAGQSVLWPDDVGPDAFSGSWRIAVIMTAAGLVVGFIHVADRQAREVNVFAALASGTIDRRAVPGALAIALTSLIGGFIGQYYNFIRLGRDGYTRIMESLRDTAMHLSSRIADMGPFEVVSDGSAIPVLAFKVKDPSRFTVFHVSDLLRTGGWQVPAYTMPENATDVAVLRIVVREGFGMDLADALLEDLQKALAHLDEFPPPHPAPAPGFSHT